MWSKRHWQNEGNFNVVANLFSLVAASYKERKSRFLFLSDAEDDVLDELAIPGKRDYTCIKAPHHGTLNSSTEFLLISRNLKEFPIRT